MSSHTDQTFWLGTVLELMQDIFVSRTVMAAELEASSNLRPSQMNRLQRSLVADRVPVVSKDSTVGVAEFLRDTLNALDIYLMQSFSSNINVKVRLCKAGLSISIAYKYLGS